MEKFCGQMMQLWDTFCFEIEDEFIARKTNRTPHIFDDLFTDGDAYSFIFFVDPIEIDEFQRESHAWWFDQNFDIEKLFMHFLNFEVLSQILKNFIFIR